MVLLELGPLGQMPQLAPYTVLTLGYGSTRDIRMIEIADIYRFHRYAASLEQNLLISELEAAIEYMVAAYPWLAGQVVADPPIDNKSSGTYKVVDYPPHQGEGKFLRVKNCGPECPAFENCEHHLFLYQIRWY